MTRAIVGLPPGTTAENAVDGLHAVAPRTFVVDTVALAVRSDDVEDQLWDHRTLFESGYTAVPEDGRTSGEFLIAEFLFADTVLATTNNLLPPDPGLMARGVQLIGELAPYARISAAFTTVNPADLGHFDDAAARSRSLPGRIVAPAPAVPAARSSALFRTFEHRIDRPLHPDRFRTALGVIAEGCCLVRGSVWIADMTDTRIAERGVGPRIALANGGTWSSNEQHGQVGEWCRGTHIALTGDDIDDADITGLLEACALTDEELQRAPVSESATTTSRTTTGHD